MQSSAVDLLISRACARPVPQARTTIPQSAAVQAYDQSRQLAAAQIQSIVRRRASRASLASQASTRAPAYNIFNLPDAVAPPDRLTNPSEIIRINIPGGTKGPTRFIGRGRDSQGSARENRHQQRESPVLRLRKATDLGKLLEAFTLSATKEQHLPHVCPWSTAPKSLVTNATHCARDCHWNGRLARRLDCRLAQLGLRCRRARTAMRAWLLVRCQGGARSCSRVRQRPRLRRAH
jgi:hypothetical protein